MKRTATSIVCAVFLLACPEKKPAEAPKEAGTPKAAAQPKAPRAPGPAEITLLFTGAENGYLLPNPDDQGVSRGGAAELLGRWETVEGHCAGKLKPDGTAPCDDASTLALSTGDNANGASISTFFKGQPTAELMAFMGYAASAFGNRDLDFGAEGLIAQREIHGMPYLAANLRPKDAEGQKLGLGTFKTFTRLDVKLAVVGLTSRKIINTLMSGRADHLELIDDEAALNDVVPIAWKDGAHAAVIITDGCLHELAPLLEKHPEWKISVAAGRACEGKYVEKAGETHLVYPGRHFNDYVRAKLSFDEKKQLAGVKAQAIEVINDDSAPPASRKARQAVEAWKTKRDTELGEVLGFAADNLEQTGEPMAKWLTTALKEQFSADVGLINRKGVRQSLPKGAITAASIYDAIPFDNQVVVAKVSGAALKTALENPEGRFSGFAKKGKDFIGAGGKKLDPKGSYTVATLDYLFAGGDGFVLNKDDPKPVFTGQVWQTAVREWTKKQATDASKPLDSILK